MNFNSAYGTKRGSFKNYLGTDKRLVRRSLINKRSCFRQDPLITLTCFVLFGVLISGFTSFGF